MAVLMQQISCGGQRKRQCNASCHNARSPKCRCICGGRFHGKAREGMLQECVKQFTKEFLEKAKPYLDEATQLALGI